MSDGLFEDIVDNGMDNARKSIHIAFEDLMKNEYGRRFLYEHLEECGVFNCRHTDCSINNAFENGKKNVGYSLINKMKEINFQLFTTMIKENANYGP